jgi:hypothetical protein
MSGKDKLGRPTKYKKEYHDDLAYKLCLLGHTDKQLGEVFGVQESTINNWKNENASFLESIIKGKDSADAKVAESLYRRATGLKVKEVRVTPTEEGESVVETTKELPPDTAAAFIWLKNRRSGKWRDKHEVEHSGEIKTINFIPHTKPKDE